MNRCFLFMTAVAFVMLAAMSNASAKEIDLKRLPSYLGANNAGSEFYLSFPPCWVQAGPGTPSCRVYVTAGTRTLITVEVEGKGFKMTKMSIPNDVVEFVLPMDIGQPYNKDAFQPTDPSTQADRVHAGSAVHVYAEVPIVCYGVSRFPFTSDGFLALPTSALGKEYVICSYATVVDGGGQWLPGEATICAPYDGTVVSFTLGGRPISITASGILPGQTRSWTLNKGDVLAISTAGTEADLGGSLVRATKPVSVMSGNMCAYVPTGTPYCDYMVEAELPIYTWGKEYHVIGFRNRQKQSIMRIFASQPDTKIFRNGQEWMTLSLATRLEGQGWVETRASDARPPTPVHVSADKPISIQMINPGGNDEEPPLGPNGISDPFQLVLSPVEQYQTQITYPTPGGKSGTPPKFNNHFLAIVYEVNDQGGIPDDMEFAVAVNGAFEFRPLKQVFDAAPGKFFSIQTNGKTYALKDLVLPGEGVYKLRCSKPFVAYAYGGSPADSYGYPTSVALGDLSRPDTNAPDPKWTVQCDGTVEGATVTDRPDVPVIRSNLGLIYMDPDSSYNYRFRYDSKGEFIAGETITTDWSLFVDNPAQDAKAVLVFVDRAGNDTVITITYSPYLVEMTPKAIDYGLLKVNEQVDRLVTLTNKSTTRAADVTRLVLQLGSQGFSLVNTNIPPTLVLQPLESRTFTVRFSNDKNGEYRDSVGFGDSCNFKFNTLVRARVGEPIIEVSDWDFGLVTVNQKRVGHTEIRNVGNVALTVTGFSGPGNPVFAIDGPGWTITPATPIVLQPGETKRLDVSFTPTAEIPYSSQIVFSNNAQTIDSICLLTGQGQAPGLEVVGFDWGRRRIDRPGPGRDRIYQGTVTLRNTATQAVNITDVIPTGDNPSFVVNRPQFVMTLAPGDSATVGVQFQPQVTGPLSVTLTFQSTAGTRTAVLQGIGIVPRVTITSPVNFLQQLTTNLTPELRPVVIENVDWQYGDVLTLTDLAISNGQVDIAGGFSASGFGYDKGVLFTPNPIVLNAGQTKSFDARFLAQAAGAVTATLATVSDAETEQQTVWNASAVDPAIPSVEASGGAAPPTCIGATNNVVGVQFRNTGSTVVRFESLNWGTTNTPPPVFTVIGAEVGGVQRTIPFDVNPGETVDILISFTPNDQNKTGALNPYIASLTILNKLQDQTVEVRGIGQFFSATVQAASQANILVGQNVKVPVIWEANNGFVGAAVRQINFVVTYDPIRLGPVNNPVTAEAGYTVVPGSVVVDPTAKTISFTVATAADMSPVVGGKIVDIEFLVFLPWDNGTVQGNPTTLGLAATVGGGNQCAILSSTDGVVTVSGECAFDVRKVRGSGVAYALAAPNPNPVGVSGADVNFSIGLDAQTEVTIADATGRLIGYLYNGQLQAGSYARTLPIDLLSSGAYIITLRSGEFTQSQTLIIQK